MPTWVQVLVPAVAVGVLTATAYTRMSRPRPPAWRPPGAPPARPGAHWPQAVYVRHDVHIWHHLPDEAARPVQGQITPGGPPALPPGRDTR